MLEQKFHETMTLSRQCNYSPITPNAKIWFKQDGDCRSAVSGALPRHALFFASTFLAVFKIWFKHGKNIDMRYLVS